jgi:protein arginine kinase activator
VTLCDTCGEREAVVHLTQIVDNTITTLHLCERCAAEKGVETGAQVAKFPLGDFLASLGKSAPAGGAAAEAAASCPGCGAALADFRQTGRLGCARCYDTFEGHLRDLLRRLHGNTQHEGERYGAPSAEPVRRLTELQERLRRAVEAEDFELAAQLRDAIRGLE